MLNDAQNRKLIGKLKRALEVFEPYVFTKIAQLPYTMYETADRLETVPDATLAAVPETRPTGKTWGGEGRYCWFLTQYTPPNELAGQPLYLYPELGGYEAMLWVNGEPYGTFATKIVVTRHGNHYCDCFTRAAVPGTPVQLAIEFYAGIMSLASSRLRNAPTGIFGLLRTKSRSAPKTRMCWTLFLTCGSCCSWWRNCRKLLSAAQRF